MTIVHIHCAINFSLVFFKYRESQVIALLERNKGPKIVRFAEQQPSTNQNSKAFHIEKFKFKTLVISEIRAE